MSRVARVRRLRVVRFQVVRTLISDSIKRIATGVVYFKILFIDHIFADRTDVPFAITDVSGDVTGTKPQLRFSKNAENRLFGLFHYRGSRLSESPNTRTKTYNISGNMFVLPSIRIPVNTAYRISGFPETLRPRKIVVNSNGCSWVRIVRLQSRAGGRTPTQCGRSPRMKEPNDRASLYGSALENCTDRGRVINTTAGGLA